MSLYQLTFILVLLSPLLTAQTPEPAAKAATPLVSTVFHWSKLVAATTINGERRAVFDGPTATLDQAHCHITTLNPGATSGEPRRHLQEEIIVVKSGRIELSLDGRLETAEAGSVFFLASNAITRMRNAGETPATYYVIYTRTPLTPKN